MKTWKVVVEVKDDGMSDNGKLLHLTRPEIKELFDCSVPAGITLTLIELTEEK